MRNVKSFFINLLLLTGTTLLLRTIGIAFTSYLSRTIGPSGIGLYQLVMSVSNLAITFAISGIRFTAIRMVSEQAGKQNGAGQKAAMYRCIGYAVCFGTAAWAFLFFGAPWIGKEWLQDTRTIPSLRLLSFILPLSGISSVMNGYFTAVRKTARSAVIQIIDQFAMIAFTIVALSYLLPYGLGAACLALVAGSCFSEMLSCILLSGCWLWERHRTSGRSKSAGKGMTQKMLSIAIPIALSSYARSGLSTMQHILVPRGLNKYGSSKEQAFAAYGMIHGMVLPLVLYPSALLITLAELLVPELTECQVQKQQARINYIATRVFKLSLIFAVLVMGILFCFADSLGETIYHTDKASFYIKLFAPLVLVMYMDTVVDGVLKGMGEQFNSMKYNVIDSTVSVILVWALIPKFGVKGYVITVMVSEILNFSLSLNRLIHITEIRLDLINTLIKPILCVLFSIIFYSSVFQKDGLFVQLMPSCLWMQIILFFIFYGILLIITNALNQEDRRWLKKAIHFSKSK